MVDAINARTASSGLPKAPLLGNGSLPVEIMQDGKFTLELAGATDQEDLRLGENIEETTSALWEATVVGLEGTTFVNVVVTAGQAPLAADSFYSTKDAQALMAFALSSVADGILEGMYLTGGRDPIDFAYTPTVLAGDEAKVRSDLPALTSAWSNQHAVAALVKIDGANGSFTRYNYVAIGTGGVTFPILDVGDDYLMLGRNPGLGTNPNGGQGGDLRFPQVTDTVTEYAGRQGNFTATAVTASVAEFHTVCELQVDGGGPPLVPPAVGDSLAITDTGTDTSTATVEKVVAHETTADKYYVVLSALINTTGPATQHGLPLTGASGVTYTGGTGEITAHGLKTTLTAGGTLYLQSSGSAVAQVNLYGTETMQRVADKVEAAIAEGSMPRFALVDSDGFLLFDCGGLDP